MLAQDTLDVSELCNDGVQLALDNHSLFFVAAAYL